MKIRRHLVLAVAIAAAVAGFAVLDTSVQIDLDRGSVATR